MARLMAALCALACLAGPANGLAGGWQRVAAGGGGRGGGGRGRSRADFAETRIFVENLSFETTWIGLKEHFLAEGYPVAFVSVSETSTGDSKGCGLVQFEEAEAATDAIERMTGTELNGRRINCRRDVQSAERRSGAAVDPDAWKTKPWTRTLGTLDDSQEVDEAAVFALLARRDVAREAKDFTMADGLLDQLEDLGAGLRDTPATLGGPCLSAPRGRHAEPWALEGFDILRRHSSGMPCHPPPPHPTPAAAATPPPEFRGLHHSPSVPSSFLEPP